MSSDSAEKFTLSYSKKDHNQKTRHAGQDINRDDLLLKYESVDSMKHFVGPAFIMCIF
jgi:hypothetical protein